jgi:hypothetical protein
MHDITIAQALGAGKPSVLVFGTPRYCTSRTCGPVVDHVEAAKQRFGDRASFVHVEVWRNDDDAINRPPEGWSPTFAEWQLGTEPWIYFVDAGGTVRDRWLGAVGADEVSARTEALIG